MPNKIRALRRGLVANAAHIDGLNVYEDWPNNAQMPCVIFEFVEAEHEQTFGPSSAHDLAVYRFESAVAVSLAGGLSNAQEMMDEYISGLGDKSLRVALASDRTLGGNACSLFFGTWTRPDDEDISGQGYLVQRLPLEIWAT